MAWRLLKVLAVSGVSSALWAAEPGEVTGRWEITTTYPGGSFVTGLTLAYDGARFSGSSAWLIPGRPAFYRYTGTHANDQVELEILSETGGTEGTLTLEGNAAALKGTGRLGGVRLRIEGRRLRPERSAQVHRFTPTTFTRVFSSATPPVLRVFSGDTIHTTTLDALGVDKDGVARSPSGNPQTGPFYIEGALPGDTLAIRFHRLHPNRSFATQRRSIIAPVALESGHAQSSVPGWSNRWIVDTSRAVATPENAGARLAGYSIPIRPMIGCVSVAPPRDQAIATADLGSWGGNLDYREIYEGATVYLPVYNAGALLTVGDGHAAQGDGEITGQGLEISMDVEMSVNVIRGEFLERPWAENDTSIMVSGIAGSVTEALRSATSGLSRWLKRRHALNDSEIATVLANSVRYDIAEIVDPHIHVVARIEKSVLATFAPSPAGSLK